MYVRSRRHLLVHKRNGLQKIKTDAKIFVSKIQQPVHELIAGKFRTEFYQL